MSKIYVVSTGRNIGSYALGCVKSVQEQALKPHCQILVDDVSDDDSLSYLDKVECSHLYDNLQIIRNTERKYRLRNIYDNAIDKEDEDIICIVDSDDWLARNTVLETIKERYDSNPKLEYVYSKYITTHGELGCSQPIPNDDWNPYAAPWITSHMSTFKVKALRDVPVDNFLDWNGQWFKIATDHAMTLPILYRLWKRDGDYSAVGFINEALYMHTFYGNPTRPRYGTPEADDRAKLAVKCSTYIKQRGYIE